MGELNGDGQGKDPTNGRFQAGNQYGGRSSGNPVARRMSALRRSVVESVTPEQVCAAMDKLHALGLAGDVQALRAWIELVVGRAPQAIEVSTPDGEGIDLRMVAAVVLGVVGDDEQTRCKLAAAFSKLGRAPADGNGLGE